MERKNLFLRDDVTFSEAILEMMRLKLRGFDACAIRPMANGLEEFIYWINPNENGDYPTNSEICKGSATFSLPPTEHRHPIDFADISATDFNLWAKVTLYAEDGELSNDKAPYVLGGCYFHGKAEQTIRENGTHVADIICTDVKPEKWLDGIYHWRVFSETKNANVTWGTLFVWHDVNNHMHGLAVETGDEESIQYAIECYNNKKTTL